jgi:hypothetical protein
MSSTAPTTARTTRGATIARALIVIGGVLVAVSSWLNWGADKTFRRGPVVVEFPGRTAYKIPAKFVIDNDVPVPSGGLSLGVVVLVLGVLVVAAAFGPGWRIVGVLLGLAAGITALLYAYQVREVIHDAAPTSPIAGQSFRDLIAIGPYVAGVGGALAVIGAVIALIPPGFWSSLTSEETPEEKPEEEEEKPAGEGGAG